MTDAIRKKWPFTEGALRTRTIAQESGHELYKTPGSAVYFCVRCHRNWTDFDVASARNFDALAALFGVCEKKESRHE